MVINVNNLLEYQKEIFDLEHTINIINWDLLVSTPKDEKNSVISLLGNLESKLFSLETSSKHGEVLEEFINSDDFDKLPDAENRYVKMMYKNYLKSVKVPHKFYVKYTELLHKSTAVWEEAKENNDYQAFKPYLKDVIEYTKKYYGYLNNGENLYDTMLNSYEEGLTCEVIDKLFNELKEKLVPLISKLNNKKVNVKMNASKDV